MVYLNPCFVPVRLYFLLFPLELLLVSPNGDSKRIIQLYLIEVKNRLRLYEGQILWFIVTYNR
jgi:hypothetical protein